MTAISNNFTNCIGHLENQTNIIVRIRIMQITDMISVNTKDPCRTDNVGKLVAFGSIVQYILMISLFSWFPKRSNTVCPFGNHINKNNNMSCPFQQYTKNMTVHFPKNIKDFSMISQFPVDANTHMIDHWPIVLDQQRLHVHFSTNTKRISIGCFLNNDTNNILGHSPVVSESNPFQDVTHVSVID